MKFLLSLLFAPVIAFASYNADHLPYTDVDAGADLRAAVAISELTARGILRGNPDGTFKPGVTMNRAEFLHIVMGLLPDAGGTVDLNCFPDVDENIWFAVSACRAKALGIVQGNVIAGLDPSDYPFQPTRSVRYEEALKVLFGVYGLPVYEAPGREWYQGFVNSAYKHTIDLEDSAVGSALTRAQMARLVAAFIAYSDGTLDELRYAQTHPELPVRTVFGPRSSSSLSLSSSLSSDSSESVQSLPVYDPYYNDVGIDSNVLVLGQVTGILGSVALFADAEPVHVHEILIDLVSANSSIGALNVYSIDGVLIGRATIDRSVSGDTRYKLSLKTKDITAPKREKFSIYVRGVLKSEDAGGVSGGTIEIDRIGMVGPGAWSNREYTVFSDSSVQFQESQLAESDIMGVSRVGPAEDVLTEGAGLEVGAFQFSGTTSSSNGKIQLLSLKFLVEQIGGVTVSNVFLESESRERISCNVSGSFATCSSIPSSMGNLRGSARVLRVIADVDVPDASQSAGVRFTLNEPGTISSAGSITWTDGENTFTWVDLDRPVARGTYFRR